MKNIKSIKNNTSKRSDKELLKLLNNGERSIIHSGIYFNDTKLETSAIGNVVSFLEGKRNSESYRLDKNRTIYQFSGNLFIIEYDDKDLMKNDNKYFKENFKPTKYLSEVEEDGNQFPEVDFKAEYNGKYYMLVKAYLELNNNEYKSNGVYKGIIFDPKKYIDSGSINSVYEVKDNYGKKINDVLD